MTEAQRQTDTGARALRWRCRRGMKELDVLLERYAAAVLPQAGPSERRLLASLLDRPDPELARYFLAGEMPPEPELADLVTRITQAGIRGAGGQREWPAHQASEPRQREWPAHQETVHHGVEARSTGSNSVKREVT